MPLAKYSVQVVPNPCSTTFTPFLCNLFAEVVQVAGGEGAGTGGAGGGGGGAGPHHFALLPALQLPRQSDSVEHPGFWLQTPQLQLASQA